MASSYQAPSTPNLKTLLPGFGRRLNYTPQQGDPDYIEKPFPTALSKAAIEHGSVAQPMTTLRELTMLQFMNSITDKKDWHIKVNDDGIADKWKDEALNSGADVTQSMVDWCIDELQYKSTLIIPGTPCAIVVYNAGVVKSDLAVSAELKDELQKAVSVFEEKIPARLKDWHPGSDEKVWDLVHPSLFPLVYGRTRVLANGETTTLEDCIYRCGEGEIAPVPPAEDTEEDPSKPRHPFNYSQNVTTPYSAKFQWLPCEVDISGTEARIATYINNLHPVEESQLYDLISKLITTSIPLWELTLSPLRTGNIHQPRIKYTEVEYDPDPESGPETDGPQREPEEDENDYWERRDQWYRATRKVVRPEPEGDFEPTEPSTFKFKDCFAAQGLQVIVKLANIELTPEKPNYEGGSWHVEGQLNEHIVATSLYYYSCQNITTSTLAFRQQCSEYEALDITYEQDHHDWLSKIFGCEQDGSCIQELGGVVTREGRLLTFPNILQHRVAPFKLEDPTKPGHRKIVALFLVDPNIKVISTAHVPCQQRDWWWEVARSMPENHKSYSSNNSGVAGLPRELQDHILEQMDDADFPISLEEAKRQRLELMEERKDYVAYNGSIFESVTFSLCEH